MDGRRHLEVAQKLAEGAAARAPLTGGNGAPECRSAISRAYYATFLVAGAFLDHVGFAVETSPSAHTAVQFALNNSGDPDLRAVASALGTLSKQRRKADYEVNDLWAEIAANAVVAVRLAADTIARLDGLRGTASPGQLAAIKGAVSVWLKGAQTSGLRERPGAR